MKWHKKRQVFELEAKDIKKPKKLTGTRLGAVLGVNPWATEFQTWCEITKAYVKPFEDTIYTVAGKTIEPKQAEYLKTNLNCDTLISPTDVYGEDYFNKTWGDFFKEEAVFGGMWDFLLMDEDDPSQVEAVVEMKTTKRIEDWKEGVPPYYALQSCLYAYLLGVDQVYIVLSVLQDKDYTNPEEYQCNTSNTKVFPISVSGMYPNFSQMLEEARQWYVHHVLGGVSPIYDEKKDAEYIKGLTTTNIELEDDFDALVKEADELELKLNREAEKLKDEHKRLKAIKEQLKSHLSESMTDNDKYAKLTTQHFVWTLAKQETSTIDKKALEKDGLLEKYLVPSTTYRLTTKEV